MPEESLSHARVAAELAGIRATGETVAEQIRLLRMPISPCLSVEDAAHALGVSRRTVDRLIAEGRLPVVSIESGRGDRRIQRVQASDLQDFVEARKRPVRGASRPVGRRIPQKLIRVPDVRLEGARPARISPAPS